MALEIYASLLLVHYILRWAGEDADKGVHIPYCTDNEGSAYCLLNANTKKWPASAVLMELLAQAHEKGVQLAPCHVKRDYNKWADDLVNGKFQDFNEGRRIDPIRQPPEWLVLPALLELGGS